MADFGVDAGISFGREIIRKTVHLSSLWMVALIYFWPFGKIFLFYFFTVCFILNIMCEYAYSCKVPVITQIYGFFFRNMLRKQPERGTWIVSGSPPVFAAAALCSLCFPRFIAACALGVMLVADTAAALIGRRFGKRKLNGSKTLEGSLAFFFAGFLFTLPLLAGAEEWYPAMISASAGGVLLACLAELFRDQLKLDDNLSIPLFCGGFMTLIYYLI